ARREPRRPQARHRPAQRRAPPPPGGPPAARLRALHDGRPPAPLLGLRRAPPLGAAPAGRAGAPVRRGAPRHDQRRHRGRLGEAPHAGALPRRAPRPRGAGAARARGARGAPLRQPAARVVRGPRATGLARSQGLTVLQNPPRPRPPVHAESPAVVPRSEDLVVWHGEREEGAAATSCAYCRETPPPNNPAETYFCGVMNGQAILRYYGPSFIATITGSGELRPLRAFPRNTKAQRELHSEGQGTWLHPPRRCSCEKPTLAGIRLGAL